MDMEIFYISLLLVVLLGALTSYTDTRHGKIRNRHLLLFLVLASAMHAVYFFAGPTPGILVDMFANLCFALLCGALFWHTGIWTSADAKLFALFSFIVPVSIYSFGYLPFFPSINILINTFFPFFLFYMARMLALTSARQKKNALKQSFWPGKILATAVSVFALMWPVRILSYAVAEINTSAGMLFQNFIFNVLVVAFLFYLMEKAFGMGFWKIAAVVSVLRIFLDKSIYTSGFVIGFFYIILLFVFTRFFLLQLSGTIYINHCDIGLLRQGMVPAEEIYFEGGEYRKRPRLYFSLFSYIMGSTDKGSGFNVTGNGLTKEQVFRIKKLKKSGRIGFEHLAVYQSLPFAPFLFIGSLVTLLAHGNVFLFLKTFI